MTRSGEKIKNKIKNKNKNKIKPVKNYNRFFYVTIVHLKSKRMAE
jgi:hypothetical protein